MNHFLQCTLAGVFLAAGFGAGAQEPERRELWVPANQLSSILKSHPNAVLLSRAEYETLLRDARPADSKAPAAPRRAVLASAQYQGSIEGKVLSVHGVLTVQATGAEWAELPLVFAGVALGAARIDGEAAILPPALKDGPLGPLTVLVRGQGEHRIEVEFAVNISSQAGKSAVSFRLPTSAATAFECQLPPNVRVTGNQPMVVTTAPAGTQATVAPGAAAEALELQWRLNGAAGEHAAEVAAELWSLYRIDADRVAVVATIQLKSTLGGLPAGTRINVPENSRVIRVTGPELARWTLTDRVIALEWQPGERSEAQVQVELEQVSLGAAERATVTLPILEIAGLPRVSGGLAIERDRTVTLRAINADPSLVRGAVDLQASPARVANYQFERPPVAPKVEVVRVRPRQAGDLDTLVEFRPDAIYVTRTLTLREQSGEAFSASVTLPGDEELLAVRRPDGSQPDWRREAGVVRVRWNEESAGERVFLFQSRVEPASWTTLGPEGVTFSVQDAQVAGVERVTGYIALQADDAFRLEALASETLEPRDGRTTPVRGDYAWFRREQFELKVKIVKRPGEVLATLTGYALPLAGVLDLHAQLDFTFLHSGARAVRVRVPAALAGNFRFDGPQIAERNLVGDIWTIVFQKELTGPYAMKVAAQAPITAQANDGARFQVAIPRITPLDVQRSSGVWAVEANTETEITFKAEAMNELDSLAAPSLADYQPRNRVIGVFAYVGGDYQLSLSGVRHEPAPVLATVVDDLQLDTVIGESGPERTEARLRVRTAGAQFLDLTLPPDSRLWTLLVDGGPVKPVSGAAGEVRVQLPAKREVGTPIRIALVYETPRPAWKARGDHRTRAPRLGPEIPILQSCWRLYLPEGYAYSGLESNLRTPFVREAQPLALAAMNLLSMVGINGAQSSRLLRALDSEARFGSAAPQPNGGGASEAAPNALASAQDISASQLRTRDAIVPQPETPRLSEETLPPQVAAPLILNGGMVHGSAAAEPLSAIAGGKAGLLPLELELPKTGQALEFSGFASAEHVEFQYENAWGRARRLWFWFVIGGLLAWILPGRRPWWRTAWAILILFFAPLCLNVALVPVGNALLGGWVVGLILRAIGRRAAIHPVSQEAFAK